MSLIPSAAGALFSAFVAALVVAFLSTDIGRDAASQLDGAGRALVAAPVIAMCLFIFGASVAALALPDQRERLQNLSLLTAFLIAAWVVMAAVILGGLSVASERVGQ
jgi:hypothetical protein